MAITRVSNSVLNLSGNTDALGLPKGTDAQRPTPVAGMLRFNTETAGFEGYDGTEWGAIGGTGSNLVQDEFVGDGTTVDFTLSVSVIAEIFTSVYISGVYQEKNAYSISGTTITFSVAPPNGASIEVITIDNIAVTTGVTSVNGEVGVVTLNIPAALNDSDELTEGTTNKYLLDDSVVYSKLGTEFTEVITYNQGTGFPSVLDFSSADQWVMNDMASFLTLNITNAQPGMVKLLSIYPWDGVLTWDAAIIVKVLNGTFDPSFNWNYIQILCQSPNTFLITISQEQV